MKASKRYFGFLIAVVFFALGAAVFSAGVSGQDDEGWQVTRADYGYGPQRTDVTDILKDLLSRGGVNGRVAVNNQTMGGDPAVGQDKTLRIFARNRRNQERKFDFREGGFVDVTMFPSRTDDWGDRDRNDGRNDRDGRDRDDRQGSSIIRGFYGVQGRTVDVSDALRSMMRDGAVTVNVSNRSFGIDPAPGADKVLIVIYRFQGGEQATAVREGNTLSIP